MPTRFNKKNKYHAVKTVYENIVYDSRAEAALAERLELSMMAGHIKEFEPKPKKIVFASGITWAVDFMIIDKTGIMYYVEYKGKKTRDYIMRLKLFIHECKEPLFVYTKRSGSFVLIESIRTDGIVEPI